MPNTAFSHASFNSIILATNGPFLPASEAAFSASKNVEQDMIGTQF